MTSQPPLPMPVPAPITVRERQRVPAAANGLPTPTPVPPTPATPVRARVQPLPVVQPTPWPQGSAVFAPGSKTNGPQWGVTDEQRPGLLGRVVKERPGVHRTWVWKAGVGYTSRGVAAEYWQALALLPAG